MICQQSKNVSLVKKCLEIGLLILHLVYCILELEIPDTVGYFHDNSSCQNAIIILQVSPE